MYDWGKEQEKEIATIKERTIYLNLSDADCKRISTYAAKQISQYHNYWKVLLEIL